MDVKDEKDHWFVKADRVKASYKDGVLEISLPKTEEAKPKEIKVEIQ